MQLELAATIDAGEPFVKATYRLEGDGPLALECFEVITMLQASINNQHYPNVNAVARQLSAGNSVVMTQLVQYAQSCIQPGLQYFTTQLGSSLKVPLAAFKAARLLNPHKVIEMLPTASDVDQLSAFPFLTSMVLSNLKAELPTYVAKADGVDPNL